MVNLDKELILQETMVELVDNRLLRSAHDCSDGGLAVALAECCFKHEFGCEVRFPVKYRADFELFGESHGRIIVSVSSDKEKALMGICNKHEQEYIKLGTVTKGRFIVGDYIEIDIKELKNRYETGIVL
jgi:phosphoribosylformylglycinamidine synthase